MTSGEYIEGPNKDAERDDDVSNGDEDVDREAVRGGGVSEAEKWENGGSNGDKN